MIIFGPVPSRRLGRSLGINNIPFKNCSYSCVYCQLGETQFKYVEPQTFYSPKEIYTLVKEKTGDLAGKKETIDYLTFVADGEPTLDENLGDTIDLLQTLKYKIAVITNGSMVWREKVQKALNKCDLVSLKVDSGRETVWHQVNRPSEVLVWEKFSEGLQEFAKSFPGHIITESMMVKGLNDTEENLEDIAHIINNLNPEIAYISIPIRPPAKNWVVPPDEKVLLSAYQILSKSKNIQKVEFLTNYEGNDFTIGENVEQDFLSIISVHPMREDAIDELLTKFNLKWDFIDGLISMQKIIMLKYQGLKYFMKMNYKENL